MTSSGTVIEAPAEEDEIVEADRETGEAHDATTDEHRDDATTDEHRDDETSDEPHDDETSDQHRDEQSDTR